jgi:hypothetical protein
MGLSRRKFIGTAGTLAAGQLIGKTAEARSASPPNRYRLLWIEPIVKEDPPTGTRGYALNNAGQLTGDYKNSATARPAPFLFCPNLDFTAGEFVPVESLLPQRTAQIFLTGPAAINDDGVLAGGALRRVRGDDVGFAYRLHPPTRPGEAWRFERGPDLDFGYAATDVHLSNAGDVVFCSNRSDSSGPKPRTRLTAWLPAASNYIDLDAGRSVDQHIRPTGCCRAGNAMMVSLFGVDSAPVRGHRLEYDVVTGQSQFHRLPNTTIQPGALGMNGRGEVVGSYLAQVTEGFAERGFQRTVDPWTLTLGTLGGARSAAYSVNSNGDIVGHAERLPGQGMKIQLTAFLWKGFQMWELAPLIDGGAPASLASGQLLINDQGIIAANVDGPYAAARDDQRAFLLIPSN